jgi:hypothetical protein
VVGYRLWATLRRRWGGYVSLVLLVGLLGGLGLGSLAAARRAQSSFSIFLAGTNPSDLEVTIYGASPGGSGNLAYNAPLTEAIRQLPFVRCVAAAVVLTGAPLSANGSPRLAITVTPIPLRVSMVSSSGRTASP